MPDEIKKIQYKIDTSAFEEMSKSFSNTSQKISEMQSAISKNILTASENKFRDLMLGTFKPENRVPEAYPISIESMVLEHKGGTKSYRVTVIESERVHMVVCRWGKVGTVGQIKVDTFNSTDKFDEFAEQKIREKFARGYQVDPRVDPKPQSVSNFSALRAALGRPLMSQLGPNDLLAIDPNAEVKGVKERQDYRWDEHGNENPNFEKERLAIIEREKAVALQLAAQKEDKSREEFYKDDPMFGAF